MNVMNNLNNLKLSFLIHNERSATSNVVINNHVCIIIESVLSNDGSNAILGIYKHLKSNRAELCTPRRDWLLDTIYKHYKQEDILHAKLSISSLVTKEESSVTLKDNSYGKYAYHKYSVIKQEEPDSELSNLVSYHKRRIKRKLAGLNF